MWMQRDTLRFRLCRNRRGNGSAKELQTAHTAKSVISIFSRRHFSSLSLNFWQALRQMGLIDTDRQNGCELPHQDQDQHSEGMVPPRREARRTSKASETSSSIPGPDHCRQIRRAPIPSSPPLPPPYFFRSFAQGCRLIDPLIVDVFKILFESRKFLE